jgi:hypothetical protein
MTGTQEILVEDHRDIAEDRFLRGQITFRDRIAVGIGARPQVMDEPMIRRPWWSAG